MAVRQIRDNRAVARRRTTRVVIVRPRTPTVREDTSPPPTRPPEPTARRRPLLLLGLLLVCAVVALVVTGRQWYEQHRLDGAHQAAVAAAKQATVDFVSISAVSVDHDLHRIAAGATGDFADEFNRGIRDVRTAVLDNEVTSQGTVLRAGLVSGDLDSAVVIVAVDATVKNKGTPGGRLSHYRIQLDLTLDPDSGRWLVSRLQFVG
jgi:Mce-associated membrane protein